METYQKILYILQIIGAGIAAAGAIYAVAVGFWKLIVNWYYKHMILPYKAVETLTKNVSTLQGAVDTLVKELTPNGGSSIKDAVNRIEKDIKHITFIKYAHLDLEDFPVFVSDGEGKCIWVNKAYCELVNKGLGELTGNSWENIICEEDREHVRDEWYRAVRLNMPFNLSFRICPDENKIYHVTCKAIGSGVTGYIGILKTNAKAYSALQQNLF